MLAADPPSKLESYRSRGDADLFLGAAIVNEPAVVYSCHPLDEYDVRRLADACLFLSG